MKYPGTEVCRFVHPETKDALILQESGRLLFRRRGVLRVLRRQATEEQAAMIAARLRMRRFGGGRRVLPREARQ